MAERLSDQLRRLASEATPGPWKWESGALMRAGGIAEFVPGPGSWSSSAKGKQQIKTNGELIVLLVNNRDNITAIIDALQTITQDWEAEDWACYDLTDPLAAFGAGQGAGG